MGPWLSSERRTHDPASGLPPPPQEHLRISVLTESGRKESVCHMCTMGCWLGTRKGGRQVLLPCIKQTFTSKDNFPIYFAIISF